MPVSTISAVTLLPTVVILTLDLLGIGQPQASSTTQLERALDRLDTNLSGAGATEPVNSIITSGPDAIPLVCDRLHRPASFEKNNPQSQQSIINISFVLLAMKETYPETLPDIVRCIFEWTLKADRKHPMRFALQSTVAVSFGNAALPSLVELWDQASYDEARFERVQQVGNDWFRFFCNRNGLEAATIDRLAELADELETLSRLNLYSQISTLAGCSHHAVTVIKDAFAIEDDADSKRTLHKIQVQAQQVVLRGNRDAD